MSTKKQITRTKVSPGNYRFKMIRSSFEMPDGIKLDSTIYMPIRKRKEEQFPVLLEVLPYRKDDTFLLMDYPTYAYFAQHGFITVKVDIRGTGGSQGQLPDREYSDQEIADILEVLKQLAALPKSNGKVGMFGISWSGFNSIQVAMENPPELKAILAMHSSDDLYHDDLHYIDGVLHLDPYHLYINHENGLPKTPDYRLDSAYFKNRFEQRPWLFRYLNEQRDGKFWSRKSLASNYDALKIPAYLIGGLLDGYRDTVVRMLEKCSAPIKAEIGPWDHSSPDGDIGPQHEWQDEAIRWFEHYLKGYDNGIAEEVSKPKRMAVYVRAGQDPDPAISDMPGQWRHEEWPMRGVQTKFFYPCQGGKLLRRPNGESEATIHYLPSAGTSAGTWWGDTTGDMSIDDGRSLVFDSQSLQNAQEIVGVPKVKLKVSVKSARANWSVRLEDVHPDGRVSLVTGAILNGRHFTGRCCPSDLKSDRYYEVELPLHFTTWTFNPGHRIRLAISNAQFPLAWPSPFKMSSKLEIGSDATSLALPVTCNKGPVLTAFEPVQDKPESSEGEYYALADNKPEFRKYTTRDLLTGETSFHHETNSAYQIKRRYFEVEGSSVWTVNDKNPSKATYEGRMSTKIVSSSRTLKLNTLIKVESNKTHFKVTVVRTLYQDGKLFRRKKWVEDVARVNS